MSEDPYKELGALRRLDTLVAVGWRCKISVKREIWHVVIRPHKRPEDFSGSAKRLEDAIYSAISKARVFLNEVEARIFKECDDEVRRKIVE